MKIDNNTIPWSKVNNVFPDDWYLVIHDQNKARSAPLTPEQEHALLQKSTRERINN